MATVRPGYGWLVGVLLAWLLGHAGAVYAEPPRLSGDVAVGMWSSDRMLDDRRDVAVGRLQLDLDWRTGDGLRWRASAWAVAAPERLDGRRRDAGLREAFLEARRLPCAPALGQRLVLWGRADGINPTDQLGPTHYRRLTPDVADQRSGSWGLHLDCRAGGGRLQVHVLDRFGFSEVPLVLPSGTTFRADPPRTRPTVAVRYESLGAAADWSVSFIEGHDLLPTLAVRGITPTGLTVGRDATAMRLLGADIAVVRGSVAFRGEAAVTDYREAPDPRVARRHSHASVVGGAEWSLGDLQTLSAQGFWRHRLDRAAPPADALQAALQDAQALIDDDLDANEYGITVRYARPLFNTRGNLNLFAVRSEPRGDWMLRGRLRYSLRDALHLVVGFDAFRGPRRSYLGNLRPNSLAFVELDYAW